MGINRFVSSDGMLTVEKHDSPNPYAVRTMAEREVSIDCSKILDTAFSYMSPEYKIAQNGKSAQCEICGAATGMSNRYICPRCWKTYEADILKGLKEATEDLIVDVI